MNEIDYIFQKLIENNFKVSTDTRKDLSGTVYFAIKGDSFDGNMFVDQALEKGALYAITDNEINAGKEKVILVQNVLKTLQDVAKKYREEFNIPIIVIGGSNGKTTSKEFLKKVLATKYNTHSTEGSFNNHLGVPLSILKMERDTEIGIFEIGANHPNEHLELLDIISPTFAVVTNNGMDHLEGFGSPEGVKKANNEIFDWALKNKAKVFVNRNKEDLMEASRESERILYPTEILQASNDHNFTIVWKNKKYETKLAGNYNLENAELAIEIGKYFNVDTEDAIQAICDYTPNSKRSEFLLKDGVNFVVDCYNANPSSMMLSIESFLNVTENPRGVILGDMLEMGEYSEIEHKKIADYILSQDLKTIVFVGENFKKVLPLESDKFIWFKNSDETREWFNTQDFKGYNFLLKGSRGVRIEKIVGL